MFDPPNQKVEAPRFQWALPFLIGLIVALLIAACTAAAFVMKIGPFAAAGREKEIESAIFQATDEVRRQIDIAAFDQLAAANNNLPSSTDNLGIKIGEIQFGQSAAQTLNELASAEARGIVKCDPSINTLSPIDRKALQQITCEMRSSAPVSASNTTGIPDLSLPVAPETPADIVTKGTVTLRFSGQNLAGLSYDVLGNDVAPQSPPTQAPQTPVPTPETPAIDTSPLAPASDNPPPEAPN